MKPMHFVFIGAIITLIGSLLPSYKFFVYSTPITLNILSIAGALITGLAALVHNSNSSAKTSRIERNTLKHLEKIENVTTNLNQLFSDLTSTAEKIKKSITGGDSFCVIIFKPTLDPKIFQLFAINQGEFPVHDCKIRITDIEAFNEKTKSLVPDPITGFLKSDGKLTKDFETKIGTILPNDQKDLLILIPVGKYGNLSSFNIFMESKTSTNVQLMRLYFNGKEWLEAYRIIVLGRGTILEEYIEEGFPEDIINWA